MARQSRNFRISEFQISLIFSPLGIAQTHLALRSLVEKVQIVGTHRVRPKRLEVIVYRK